MKIFRISYYHFTQPPNSSLLGWAVLPKHINSNSLFKFDPGSHLGQGTLTELNTIYLLIKIACFVQKKIIFTISKVVDKEVNCTEPFLFVRVPCLVKDHTWSELHWPGKP